MDTKAVGELSEIKILAKLVELGFPVLIPFGDNQRYDLVFENQDGELKKVQCKHGTFRNGAIICRLVNVNVNSGGYKILGYKEDVDFFGIYCRDLDKCYMLDVRDIEATYNITLRVDKPRSKQAHKINWAKDYEI